MTTKSNEIYQVLRKRTHEAITLAAAEALTPPEREALRSQRRWLADAIAQHLTDPYNILELFDVFEWKRQRVRR